MKTIFQSTTAASIVVASSWSFAALVSQLAKPNEKFVYGAMKKGARAREFEEAIEWLVSAGLVNRVYNVSKPEHPLKAYDQLQHFKLFLFDTGLLKTMAGIDNSAILLGEAFQFKGPLTENYVLQELQGKLDISPRYYSEGRTEIDFVLQIGSSIIPVEVKAGEDKSAPSFKNYIAAHHPSAAVRFSRRAYRTDGNITNIPLYLAEKTAQLLAEKQLAPQSDTRERLVSLFLCPSSPFRSQFLPVCASLQKILLAYIILTENHRRAGKILQTAASSRCL